MFPFRITRRCVTTSSASGCTGARALTVDAPLFYAQTSGSTGKPKYIPVSAPALRIHRAEQALFTYLQYRACPAAFSGQALGHHGRGRRGPARFRSPRRLGLGIFVRVASRRGAIPVRHTAAALGHHRLRSRSTWSSCGWRSPHPDISYLGSPNPSTFLRLLEILNNRRDVLARSLETGALPEIDALDAGTRAIVVHAAATRSRTCVTASVARHGSLSRASGRVSSSSRPGPEAVAASLLTSCARRCRPQTSVMELGYQSTECRATIALDAETPGGLPPLHHHFFEFVEQGRWDSGQPGIPGSR